MGLLHSTCLTRLRTIHEDIVLFRGESFHTPWWDDAVWIAQKMALRTGDRYRVEADGLLWVAKPIDSPR